MFVAVLFCLFCCTDWANYAIVAKIETMARVCVCVCVCVSVRTKSKEANGPERHIIRAHLG